LWPRLIALIALSTFLPFG